MGIVALIGGYLYYKNKKKKDEAASGSGSGGGSGSAATSTIPLVDPNIGTKITAALGSPNTSVVSLTDIVTGNPTNGGGIGNAPILNTNNPSPINSNYPTQVPLRNNVR